MLVDPKGDLVTDVLARLPAAAPTGSSSSTPTAAAASPCLNPLDIRAGNTARAGGALVDLTVDNLVSVFRRVYAAFWGPRTDDVMRAACLTLAALTPLPASPGFLRCWPTRPRGGG